MTKPSSTRALRFLAIAVAAAALVAPSAVRSADAPVQIPVVDSVTGQFAFMGSVTAKALAIIESMVNKEGGIRGRPVKFVIQDDQTNPQVSVQLVSQAIAANAPLIVAGQVVALCRAPMALLKANGPLLYCFSPGVHPDPGSWTYSMSFSTTDQIPGAFHFMHFKNFKRVAIITTTDATGQEADSTIDDLIAKDKDLTVVAREHLAVTDISAAAQISRIKAATPDAVLVWMSGTPLGTVLHAMHDDGLDAPAITTGGNLTYAQMDAYKSIMPKDLFIMGIPAVDGSTIRDPNVTRLIAQYQQIMRANGLPADGGTAFTWATARLIVDAYRRAGPDATSAQLRDAINASTSYSVYGRYDFKASPQRGILPYWLVVDRWNPDTQRFQAVTKPGDLFPMPQ